MLGRLLEFLDRLSRDLLADAWAHSAPPPNREDLMFLIEGVRLFPGHLRMLYQAAGLSAQANMLDVAHAFADHGIRTAPDPKGKARFEALKASLPPAPPPALGTAAPPAPKR